MQSANKDLQNTIRIATSLLYSSLPYSPGLCSALLYLHPTPPYSTPTLLHLHFHLHLHLHLYFYLYLCLYLYFYLYLYLYSISAIPLLYFTQGPAGHSDL